MKKALSFLLSSLLIAISVCCYSPIFAGAETDPASNLEFRLYDFSTPIYVVAGIADGKPKKVTVPSIYKGCPVARISDGAFADCDFIEELVISDGVTEIAPDALKGCTGLKKLSVPDSLFEYSIKDILACKQLQYNEYNGVLYLGNDSNPYTLLVDVKDHTLAEYEIHEKTHLIAPGAFCECENMTSVDIPEKIVRIGKGAFAGTAIKEFTLPDSLRALEQAFPACTEKIDLGNGVNEISERAFCGLENISEIYLPDSIERISASAFEGCINLKKIRFPQGITKIENKAFGNTAIESITIPEGVEYIYDSVFAGCQNLRSVFLPDSLNYIGANVFDNCPELTSLEIPTNVHTINPLGSSGLKSITVAEENPTYRSQNNCIIRKDDKTLVLGISDCTIPDDGSVKAIEKNAFLGNDDITAITVPSSVERIGDSAFRDCSNLKSVMLSEGIKYVGSNAFKNCELLADISLPDSICSVGSRAFERCNNLIYNELDGASYLGNLNNPRVMLFTVNDKSITSFDVTSQTKAVGASAFTDCPNLRSISFSKETTSLNTDRSNPLISGCPVLETLYIEDGNPVYSSEGNCIIDISAKSLIAGCIGTVIPDDGSVIIISPKAFYGSGIKKIVIPQYITEIGEQAFANCPFIESMNVDTDNESYCSSGNCILQRIGSEYYVLTAGCKNSVIPEIDSLSRILGYAFYGCTGIESIYIPDNIRLIENTSFSQCGKVKELHIGANLSAISTPCFTGTYPDVITVDENNAEYSSEGNCLIQTEVKRLIKGTPTTVIPDDGSVEKLDYNAFSGVDIESIFIPKSIYEIGERTFVGCEKLKSITVDKDNYVYYADSYGLVEKITNRRIATIAVPKVVQKTPYIIISTAAVSVLIIASCLIARKKVGALLPSHKDE